MNPSPRLALSSRPALGAALLGLLLVLTTSGCSPGGDIPADQSPIHPKGVGKVNSAEAAREVAAKAQNRSPADKNPKGLLLAISGSIGVPASAQSDEGRVTVSLRIEFCVTVGPTDCRVQYGPGLPGLEMNS